MHISAKSYLAAFPTTSRFFDVDHASFVSWSSFLEANDCSNMARVASSLHCLAAALTMQAGFALHGSPSMKRADQSGPCVAPGICTPPNAAYSRVILDGNYAGVQWESSGGFCGAFSTQHAALAFGAWISQDYVRRANRDQPGPHHMHGDPTVGYEVMPSNVAYTATHLRLNFDEWDYTQPSPQAPAYKKWLKSHLVKGHPVVWFPICKGDPHQCYPDSCPNGGSCDHVEPMVGIFSNHSLDDPTVYDDDWILHFSDQDLMPYYRPINSLEDSLDMNGNCADAVPGFGHNEMYPCFDQDVTYGLAVTGLNVTGPLLPVSLFTTGAQGEPNVREGQPSVPLTGKVTVSGLKSGSSYVLYRYNGTDTLPQGPPWTGYEFKTPFTAKGQTWTYTDPKSFDSDSAIYYLATPA